MMVQGTKRENELYDKLKETTDPAEIAKIRQELHEIAIQQDENLKDCPFVH